MAYFAKIGLNNKVISVHSVHDNELKDSNGVEQENIGIEFLTNLHGWPIWKQTSYNGSNIRKNFAGVGLHMMKIEMHLFHLNLIILGY
jgi:hypothetical protein